MRDKIYLLDVTMLISRCTDGDAGGIGCDGTDNAHNVQRQYIQKALEKLDASRRKKAEGIKQERARAASIGAGLLLQWAAQCLWYSLCGCDDGEDELWDMERMEMSEAITPVHVLNVEELLTRLNTVFPLTYRYGKSGKPYWEEIPLYFSLSHSGKYVLCAVSEQEIGADIQEIRSEGWEKTSQRYFAEEELAALGNYGKKEAEKLFFRLWTRKEACGKLTGQGVAAMLSKNMLEAGNINWLKLTAPDGYEIAICTQGNQ